MSPNDRQPKPEGPEQTVVVPHNRTIAGKYRLLRLIGEGGMGSVYEAEHVGLGLRVAIKMLAESFSEDQVFVRRFRREARAAAAVGHENVVSVTDTGTDEDGIPFLVMELLDGESLASVLRRARTLTAESASGIVYQVLAGLGAAHERGVVHRDLKPANVFLVLAGEERQLVKILDFGISKFTADVNNQVTQEGAVIGTPSYMAPEQVRGNPDVDGRADLYAVGVMLYRMVCGKLPFAAKQTREIYQKILDGQCLAPRELQPNLSRALERVIQHAMRPDANERYQTAADFQQALVEAIPSLESTNPIPIYSRDASPNTHSHAREVTKTSASEALREGVQQLRDAAAKGHGPRRARWTGFLFGVLTAVAIAIAGAGIFLWQRQFVDPSEANRPGGAGAAGAATQAAAGINGLLPPLNRPVLRYGVPRHAAEKAVRKEHEPLIAYLRLRLRRPVELTVLDPETVPDALRRGTIQLASFSAVPYVQAKNEIPRLRLLATAFLPAGPSYKGLVVVQSESDIGSLKDLSGKRFCYTNVSSSSGYHYPRALFRRAGMDPDRAFSSVVFTQDHQTSIRLLASGRCDGAAIYESMLYDQASHGFDYRLFRSIAETGAIPYDAYCVNADRISEADAAELEEALLALEPGSRLARQALGRADVQGFVRGNDAAYDTAREVLRYLHDFVP